MCLHEVYFDSNSRVWSLFLRIQLTIGHHWLRWWFGPEDVTNLSPRSDDNIVYWHIYAASHDDVIKRKNFPRYWPFVWGIRLTGEFPTQRPMTRSFDVFFDLRLNKLLSKQSWGWWFETLLRPLWRYYNGFPKGSSRIQHARIGVSRDPFLLTWINLNPDMNK